MPKEINKTETKRINEIQILENAESKGFGFGCIKL